MIGDVYDYNKDRVYIMSDGKRVIIDFFDNEYQEALQRGMRIGATVIFNYENRKTIKFY